MLSHPLASGLSGTCESAREAARLLGEDGHAGRVEVLDSQTGAGGLGCLVLLAAELAEQGADADGRSSRRSREARESLDIWFCLDTLEYLRRGGRIGAAQAVVGTALKLKPILTFGTEIAPVGRVRTHQRAFERMVAYLRELHERGASDWIVQHAQAPDDAERLVEQGSEIFGFEPLFCTQVGPVLGRASRRRHARRRHDAPAPLSAGRASSADRRRYLTILMMRSMPSRVCGRPSCVGMKQTCTYQPGLAVMVSCWKAPEESGPAKLAGGPATSFSRPFSWPVEQTLDDLLGSLLALHGEAEVHVHEVAFVFEAHDLADVERRSAP